MHHLDHERSTMGVGSRIGKALAPLGLKVAPKQAFGFVRQVLELAIDGFGKYPGAAAAGDKRLRENGGDVQKAIHDVIESHVRMAGVQGFLTNLGGVVTLAVTIPANVTGLAVLQCHAVATIAHLRGYDLEDPRVRNAVLACMLGEETVNQLVKSKRLPSSPMGIATAPAHDPELNQRIAVEVTQELVAKVSGKRMATAVGRRVPVVGGGIGAASDGFSTWRVGRYADRALLPRGRSR
ncbi:MAG TPA: EcsC family protein [Nocardioidaceae bacterium]|nr:EcsC family protein [Nocardioidaceae bacterium]